MKPRYKTIGILGGMGPEATADLYMKIIRIFQERFGAKYDSDFPPFVIYSVPIPDVVERLEEKPKIVAMLIEGVRKLELSGADFIAVACNTVQCFLPEMRASVKIPILSIPAETTQYVLSKRYKKIALLATQATLDGKTYDKDCNQRRIELLKPDKSKQEIVTKVIMNVLAGQQSAADKAQLIEIINNLMSRGAQAVILGCTDLPLVIKQQDTNCELFDTTQILACAVVRECRSEIK